MEDGMTPREFLTSPWAFTGPTQGSTRQTPHVPRRPSKIMAVYGAGRHTMGLVLPSGARKKRVLESCGGKVRPTSKKKLSQACSTRNCEYGISRKPRDMSCTSYLCFRSNTKSFGSG